MARSFAIALAVALAGSAACSSGADDTDSATPTPDTAAADPRDASLRDDAEVTTGATDTDAGAEPIADTETLDSAAPDVMEQPDAGATDGAATDVPSNDAPEEDSVARPERDAGTDTGSPDDDTGPSPDDAVGPAEDTAIPADAAAPECGSDADCNDLSVCTIDRCVRGACVAQFVACEDENACTLDGCDPLAGCMYLDLACPDANACGPTVCNPALGTCESPAGVCDDANPCTTDSCDASTGCSHTLAELPGCCEETSDCGAASGCAAAECVDHQCIFAADPALGCCPQPFAEDFDTGVAGAVTAQTTVGGLVSVVPPAAFTPSPALAIRADDGASTAFSAVVSLPLVSLPAQSEIALRFDVFLGLESDPNFDTFALTGEALGQVFTLWEKGQADAPLSTWQTVTVNLSALSGQTVALTWTLDTVDAVGNDSLLVALDNVELSASCALAECTSDSHCSHAWPPLTGRCVEGQCSYDAAIACTDEGCPAGPPCAPTACEQGYCVAKPVAECCQSGADCDDLDPCTLDLCLASGGAGSCVHAGALHCCSNASDCDDGNPCTAATCNGELTSCTFTPLTACCRDSLDCASGVCTAGFCVAGKCESVPTCCTVATDCATTNPCRVGACANGVCVYTVSTSAQCCAQREQRAGFDGTLPSGWELQPPEGEVGFHLCAGVGLDGSGALCCSNPATGTYASSFVGEHIAKTAPFVASSASKLVFRMWLENEFSAGASGFIGVDSLSVYFEETESAARTLLWTSAAPKAPWWAEGPGPSVNGATYSTIGPLDLSKLVGKEGKILFAFQTFDAWANDFAGLRVDEVTFLGVCSETDD